MSLRSIMGHVFNRLLSFLLIISGALALQQCADSDSIMVKLKDHEYMPLVKGGYHEYEVSETVYTNGPDGETSNYQLRLEVMDSMTHSSGYYSYVVYRSTRPDATASWSYLDTWTITFTDREAIVQEGNVSYVKIALPVQVGIRWNGNEYNSLGEDEYQITQVGGAFTNTDFNFSDVIEVTQNNDVDNIVGNDVRKEVYARGVGLVKSTQETIVYCSNNQNCINKQIIESGIVREQVLIAYGKD